MEYILEKDVLNISIEGELNSVNSESVGEEIDKIISEQSFKSLVLDFDIKTGGNYINFVSLENLVLMGDEVPEFDFNTSNSGEGE